ncbi:MAG: hypothetical protein ACTSXP_11790 [Promethearchaeota archaeon]
MEINATIVHFEREKSIYPWSRPKKDDPLFNHQILPLELNNFKKQKYKSPIMNIFDNYLDKLAKDNFIKYRLLFLIYIKDFKIKINIFDTKDPK